MARVHAGESQKANVFARRLRLPLLAAYALGMAALVLTG